MSGQSSSLPIRMLDRVLHAAGALGLSAIVLLSCRFAYSWAVGPETVQPPVHRNLKELQERLASMRLELAEFQKQLGAVEQKTSMLRRRTPPEMREAEFLRQVAEVAGQTGFAIREFRPGSPAQIGGYGKLEIQFSGSGDYPSICRFLDGISRLPRLFSVERLQITAAPAADAYPVTLVLAVYFGNGTSDSALGAQGKAGGGPNA